MADQPRSLDFSRLGDGPLTRLSREDLAELKRAAGVRDRHSASPQGHNPFELGERRIGAGQDELISAGLGREQAVERIAVRY